MGLLTTFMENDIMPTKQQVAERRERWVEALRSGKYKQGKQVLHDIDNNTYCCLGVACDLFKDDTKLQLGTQNMYMSHQGTRVQTYDNHPFYLPVSVAEFLNIKDTGALKCGSTLGYKNDKGATFNEIADIIESGQLKELYELEEGDTNMGAIADISGHQDLQDSDVYQILDAFVGDKKEFTAYDITKLLRNKGFWAEHSSVRDLVHEYMNTKQYVNGVPPYAVPDYSCVNEEVKPGIWAKKYVPAAPSIATTLQKNKLLLDGKIDNPSPTPTPVIKGGAKYAAGQSVRLQPTRRGGVSVPKQLIAAIGLKAGDSVVVTKFGNFATLMQGYATKYHSAYTVDKYGRVVVTKAVLHKAGLFDNQNVYAYVTGNSITLRDS